MLQKHKSGAVGHHQWGKYGIINETEYVLVILVHLRSLTLALACTIRNKSSARGS